MSKLVATRFCVRMWRWPSGEEVQPPVTKGAVKPNVPELHSKLEEHSGAEC